MRLGLGFRVQGRFSAKFIQFLSQPEMLILEIGLQ